MGVKEINGTNILELQVVGPNAQEVARLANLWVEEYKTFNREIISGVIEGSGDVLSYQHQLARENLRKAQEAIAKFTEMHNLDLLKQELELKKKKIIQFKDSLVDSKLLLKVKEDTLNQLNEVIVKEDKFIVVNKAVSEEPLLLEIVSKELKERSVENLRLHNEVVNEIYQNLRQEILNTEVEITSLKSKKATLEKMITDTAEEIKVLTKTVEEKEPEFVNILQRLNTARTSFNTFSVKLEETKIARAMEIGEIKVISPAVEPKVPFKPNFKMNLTLAGILGLMMGVFVAFFLEYWQSPLSPTTKP
jgi:uncharacterized protein involved in exopolysaccharide biosynthesis